MYNLKDSTQVSTLVHEYQFVMTANGLSSDFVFFISTLAEALDSHVRTDLRFDTPTGLDVITGYFKDINIDYHPDLSVPSYLIFDFETLDKKLLQYNIPFAEQFTERNDFSKPGSFMKYYINSSDREVLMGIITYYEQK